MATGRKTTASLSQLIAAQSRTPALQSSTAGRFIDPSTFQAEHLSSGTPGLFRSLTSARQSPFYWPAHAEWPKPPGALGGLRQIEGLRDVLVDVEVAPVGRGYGDGVVQGQHAGEPSTSWTQVRMPFLLFLDAFIDGKIPWASVQSEGTNDVQETTGYVAQQDLFDVAPMLGRHCPPLPHAEAGVRGAREQWRRNVWIGGAGTFTPLHCDPYENLFVQVVGTKRVHVFPPDARGSLYLFDKATRQPNTSSVPTEAPLLDIEGAKVDCNRYPLLQEYIQSSRAHHAILQPGDVLYIPQGWFHCIASLGLSASVNAWFR